ncbi:MAG TPA: sigma factor [Solirubrobacteraceae bacterium]|nr:sigma factor [Solirubrobacteraceae bacterium]
MSGNAAAQAVGRAFREEGPAILATLARQAGGDVGLAEDALQDALAVALITWPHDGIPRVPAAWITTTARRKAIDRLRRERGLAERTAALDHLMRLERDHPEEEPDSAVGDDRLRLVFTCCHPALMMDARVALTLRMLGGLTTAEVARAFLVPEPTMAQRLVRAKRKIAAAHIPYRGPAHTDLPEPLARVLALVYLVFNEGHRASAGDALVREDLCAEAIRLARLLTALMPDDAETLGLLALMLLHDARRAARTGPDGGYVPLDRQDRAGWDRARIDEGTALLDRALRLRRPGPYQLQAAISALHAQAPHADATDWPQIAALYGRLAQLAPSPVVEVNRAVAVAFAQTPQAGLDVLAPLLADDGLAGYQPLHAAHAELLRRAGDGAGAASAYERAIALTGNAVELEELEARRAAL